MEKQVKDKVDFEEQIALELESRVLGINRYEKNNEKTWKKKHIHIKHTSPQPP